MKALLALSLIAAAIPAAAEESQAAGFPNNAGGMTIITTRNERCGRHNMFDGYSFSGSGLLANMCWDRHEGAVLVVYEDGDIYVYAASLFKELEVEPEVNFTKPQR